MSAEAESPTKDNADWGRTVETTSCDTWPALEHVSADNNEPDWYDGRFVEDVVTGPETRVPGLTVVEAGTLAEIKACRIWVSDGSSRRRGRWWIRKSSHDRLVEADGTYVLGIYNETTNEIPRLALVAARTVDTMIESWSACGPGHRADRCAQLSWSRVFSTNEEAWSA